MNMITRLLRNEIRDLRHRKDEPDISKNREIFNQLAGAAAPLEAAQGVLTGPITNRTVTVSSEVMGRLEEAQGIASVVRVLVKAGNQELAIKESKGRSYLLQDYAADLTHFSSVAEEMILSVLLRVANCRGHARLAFEIAKSLNIPCVLYSDKTADHDYVVLYPDAESPLVIDSWSAIPTVCRLRDFKFNIKDKHVVERHSPADGISTRLDLEAILAARDKLEDRLGKDGIASVLFEKKRKELGISSRTLDQVMLKQGVTNYYDIDGEEAGLSPSEKDKIKQKLTKVERKVQEAVLRVAERACGNAGRTVVRTTNVQPPITVVPGTNAEIAEATEEAVEKATREARLGAENAANLKAQTSAERKVSHRATKEASTTYTSTVTKGGATVSATATATACAKVKKYMWDHRFSAKTSRYEVNVGEAVQFDLVPTGHAEKIEEALKKPRVTFTMADEWKAKLHKRVPTAVVRSMQALDQKVKDKANNIRGKPDRVTQAELQAAAERCVTSDLSLLGIRPADLSVEQRPLVSQKELLERIDKRIESVSQGVINAATNGVIMALDDMDPEVFDLACEMVDRWLDIATASDEAMVEWARIQGITLSSDDESL